MNNGMPARPVAVAYCALYVRTSPCRMVSYVVSRKWEGYSYGPPGSNGRPYWCSHRVSKKGCVGRPPSAEMGLSALVNRLLAGLESRKSCLYGDRNPHRVGTRRIPSRWPER